MAETVSRILIKSSNVKPSPNTGDLQRAELAYSYTSDKLFIGDEVGQDFHVIGGKAFLDLFKDVLNDNGIVYAGKVFPNNVIVAGANNNIDTLDIETLKINGRELVTGGIEELITDNTLPNVSHTKLITAQATKEYVESKTKVSLEDFDENTLAKGQLLVVDDELSFSNRTITGVVEFTANGNTSLRSGSIENNMIANNFIQVGTQKIELGKAALVHLNLDTSSVLDVQRGGTGRYDLEKYNVLLSNNTNNIHTTNDFYYDWDQEELFVKGNTTITESANVGISLTVSDSLFASTDRFRFRDFFQILTVGGGNSYDSTIVSMDTISEYYSFSSGTVLNVSSAGLVNILSPTLFFGSEVTISDNTITNIHGLLKVYNNTEFSGNSISISDNTITTVNGISFFNDNVFVNGNTLNVSIDTLSTFFGPLHSLSTANLHDTFVHGNTLNVSINTFSEFYGNTFIYGESLNTSPNTLSTFDGPVIINGQLDVNGDVTFRGNTTYLGENFTVSNNTTVDISGNTFFKSDQLNVSSNTITTVDGESTFNKKVDINAPLTVYDNAEVKGNLVVEQDLFVYGNSTQILTETLTVEDNIIVLAANNITDVVDLGFAGRYNESGTPAFAGLFRDATNNKFFLFEDYPTEPPITSMVGFDSATMLATLFADIEANTIIAHKGTLDDVVITNSHLNDSFASNLTSNNATLNDATIYNSVANNLTSNNATLNTGTINGFVINNSHLNNSFANNLTSNNATLNTGTIDSFTITNSHLNDSFANNLTSNNATLNSAVLNNATVHDSFANNITANNVDINFGTIRSVSIYNSTIYDSSIVDDSTANNLTSNNATLNSVVIETATANNITSNNAVLNTATIYNAVANNLLSNNATLYFAKIYDSNLFNAHATTLSVDVLDAGSISFRTAIENVDANNYTGNTATIDDIVANNITTNTFTSLVKTEATEEIKILGVSGTSGKLVLNCSNNSHGQTVIAQPHSASVTNILTLPAGGNQELVGTDAQQTLTSKTLDAPSVNNLLTLRGDGSSVTGQLKLNCHDNSHGQTIIAQPHSAGVTNVLTLPAGSDQEIVGTTATQTLVSKTLDAPSIENLLTLRGDGSSVTGQLKLNCHDNSHGQTIIAQPHSAGVTNVLTLPAGANQEFVGTLAQQTLTNKTLTSPQINDATLGGITTINGNTTITENLTINKDLTVDGNLFLTGTTVTLDAQTLTVEDNIILLSSNNAADVIDTGFAGKYNNGSSDLYAGIFRDATDGVFYIFKDYTSVPGTTMAGFNIATMRATLAGDFEANNIIVDSGSFENVTSNNTTITNSTISDTVIDCGTF